LIGTLSPGFPITALVQALSVLRVTGGNALG